MKKGVEIASNDITSSKERNGSSSKDKSDQHHRRSHISFDAPEVQVGLRAFFSLYVAILPLFFLFQMVDMLKSLI